MINTNKTPDPNDNRSYRPLGPVKIGVYLSLEPGSKQTLLPQKACVKTKAKKKKLQTADLFSFFKE